MKLETAKGRAVILLQYMDACGSINLNIIYFEIWAIIGDNQMTATSIDS